MFSVSNSAIKVETLSAHLNYYYYYYTSHLLETDAAKRFSPLKWNIATNLIKATIGRRIFSFNQLQNVVSASTAKGAKWSIFNRYRQSEIHSLTSKSDVKFVKCNSVITAKFVSVTRETLYSTLTSQLHEVNGTLTETDFSLSIGNVRLRPLRHLTTKTTSGSVFNSLDVTIGKTWERCELYKRKYIKHS